MHEHPLVDAVISLVPNWYRAEHGPVRYALPFAGRDYPFFSLRKLTPDLTAFYACLQEDLDKVAEGFGNVPALVDYAQEVFALKWLEIKAGEVNWEKVFTYVRCLAQRTHENHPVAVNCVVSAGSGRHDVTSPALQKFIDQLANTPHTFLRVDRQLNYLGYEEVGWTRVTDSPSYKFHPEFLHPMHCVLKEGEVSFHLTDKGDLVIMDARGLLAAKRKGQWKVYDVATFKNALGDVLGASAVGANIFEVVFDLSFKRHGALLVYDPHKKVLPHVLNPDSIISPRRGAKPGPGQALIADAVRGTSLGGGVAQAIRNKRLLMEIASIDGAVLFDNRHLLAVGAMIEHHEAAGGQAGARTAAARSAYHWGGRPIKVSTDGEVTVYFESRQGQRRCDARLEYL